MCPAVTVTTAAAQPGFEPRAAFPFDILGGQGVHPTACTTHRLPVASRGLRDLVLLLLLLLPLPLPLLLLLLLLLHDLSCFRFSSLARPRPGATASKHEHA